MNTNAHKFDKNLLSVNLKILYVKTKVIPINKFTSPNKKFVYHTFLVTVEEEFIPILNNESDGYCWIKIGNWPRPLHPGAKIQCNSKQFVKKIKTVYEQFTTSLD